MSRRAALKGWKSRATFPGCSCSPNYVAYEFMSNLERLLYFS